MLNAKKGDRVSFQWETMSACSSNLATTDTRHGVGTVITDEDPSGHVLVAMDPPAFPAGQPHHVIWCAITWLTLEPT